MDIKGTIDSLRQLRGLEGDVAKFSGVLGGLGTLIDSLQDASALLQSAEQSKGVIEKQVEFLKKEEVILAQKVDARRKESQTLDTQVAKLSTERDALRKDIEGLEAKLAEIVSRHRR
jgi:uncharacterized coiled-coil DUF342 family protein